MWKYQPPRNHCWACCIAASFLVNTNLSTKLATSHKKSYKRMIGHSTILSTLSRPVMETSTEASLSRKKMYIMSWNESGYAKSDNQRCTWRQNTKGWKKICGPTCLQETPLSASTCVGRNIVLPTSPWPQHNDELSPQVKTYLEQTLQDRKATNKVVIHKCIISFH